MLTRFNDPRSLPAVSSRSCLILLMLASSGLLFAEDDQGRSTTTEEIPADLQDEAKTARDALIEAAADFDDAIMADFLDGNPVAADRIRSALRQGTLSGEIVTMDPLIRMRIRSLVRTTRSDAPCLCAASSRSSMSSQSAIRFSGQLTSFLQVHQCRRPLHCLPASTSSSADAGR